MSTARRAALAVHALPPSERAWLLSQLSEDQAAALQPLLSELGELGIPGDQSLVDEALRDASLENAPLAGPMSRVDVDQVAAVLQHEPEAVMAIAVSRNAFPWCEALLQRFDAAKRERIRSAASASQGADRLYEAVLRELEARVARFETTQAPAIRTGPALQVELLSAMRSQKKQWWRWTR